MSYRMDEPTGAVSPRRRRWPWVAAAVLLVALVAAAAFVAGRHGSTSSAPTGQPPAGGSAPAAPAPSGGADGVGPVQWQQVSGAPVPVSAQHGPFNTTAGRGYSHDTAGAVLAAINTGTRSSASTTPGTAPNRWWYRVSAGNPRGDLVQLALVAQTPQSQQMGGYVRREATLHWSGGDWQLQQPSPRPQLDNQDPQQAGYTPVGGP